MRGGQPSMTTPTPAPWDSPQVLMRYRTPKLLDMTAYHGARFVVVQSTEWDVTDMFNDFWIEAKSLSFSKLFSSMVLEFEKSLA
jgi:hypothetical protein